jgi:hypothetical protein
MPDTSAKKEATDFLAEVRKLAPNRQQQQIAEDTVEEFRALTAGREKCNTDEAVGILRYALLRTDLEKKEEYLSINESMWKIVFEGFSKGMKEKMNADQITMFEELERKMRKLDKVTKKETSKMTEVHIPEIHEKIEELLQMQAAYIAVHFDEDTGYKKAYEALMQKTDESKTTEEKIANAKQLIELAEIHKEKIVEPLIKVNDDLGDWFFYMEKSIDTVTDPARKALCEKWYELSKRYYLNKRKQANYIIVSNELDLALPRGVVENKGDTSTTTPGAQELLKNYMLMTGVLQVIGEEIDSIDKQRHLLGARIFPTAKQGQQQTPDSVQGNQFKLDFDARRFLKAVATLYVPFALIGMIGASESGTNPLMGLLIPVILLFQGGFVFAIVLLFIIYCGWIVWEKRQTR